jgi:DNA topoisomerase IA
MPSPRLQANEKIKVESKQQAHRETPGQPPQNVTQTNLVQKLKLTSDLLFPAISSM